MRRNQLKPNTKKEFKRDLDKAKSTVKEKAGWIVNNPDLTAEGLIETHAWQGPKESGTDGKGIGDIKESTLDAV
jgi:hypothetical protein